MNNLFKFINTIGLAVGIWLSVSFFQPLSFIAMAQSSTKDAATQKSSDGANEAATQSSDQPAEEMESETGNDEKGTEEDVDEKKDRSDS